MKNKWLIAYLLIAITCSHNIAQNPIVPAGIYLADPSAHVFNGKLYVYGSLDESPDYWCSHVHHILSTSDCIHWQLHKNVFASKGKNDQVPYNDNILYAPDCGFYKNKFYLSYCQPGNDAEGIAISDKPEGPFVNGKKLELYGYNQIDPSLFVDDDGTAYYTWGQMNAKLARLNADMTLDSTSIKDNIVTEKEHFFHEGGYLTKRKDTYYYIYAHSGRENKPTCIGYATSKSVWGPYKYGGVIIDNKGCDPDVWNNHGSIVEFNHQWYVFYHRSINGKSLRRACIEPIYFNADGSINEVEMTSQGAGKPLSAFDTIDAGRACMLHGNLIIQPNNVNNEVLAKIDGESRAAFKYIDFGNGVDSITAKVRLGKTAGGFNIRIGQPWGAHLGYLHIPAKTENQEWQIIGNKIKNVSGIHALWLCFYLLDGAKESDIEIDWIKFHKK